MSPGVAVSGTVEGSLYERGGSAMRAPRTANALRVWRSCHGVAAQFPARERRSSKMTTHPSGSLDSQALAVGVVTPFQEASCARCRDHIRDAAAFWPTVAPAG